MGRIVGLARPAGLGSINMPAPNGVFSAYQPRPARSATITNEPQTRVPRMPRRQK